MGILNIEPLPLATILISSNNIRNVYHTIDFSKNK